MNKVILRLFFSISALFIFVSQSYAADNNNFVVVLDAGHGGHDPGAVGPIIYEKKINLGVILALGEMISKSDPKVKVVYTRKTDVFIPLQERADIANNAKADLFISVHTNANNNPASDGAETYTLGLTKSKSNLDVAMRENSVILLEDDYKVKYEGFNPKSVDSYIMFECIQDKYLDKSVQIASEIQKNFVSAGRKDRGVRQAGFWVLHKTAMPSILVEVGYISNPEEERFLASDAGQQKMASAIFAAFEKFKKEYERKSGKQNYVSASSSDLASASNISNNVVPEKHDSKKAKEKSESKFDKEDNEKFQSEMKKAMAQANDKKKNVENETTDKSDSGNSDVQDGKTYSMISSSKRTLEPEKVRVVPMGDDDSGIQIVADVAVVSNAKSAKSATKTNSNPIAKATESKPLKKEAVASAGVSNVSSESKRTVIGASSPTKVAPKPVTENAVSVKQSKVEPIQPKEAVVEKQETVPSVDNIVYKVQLYAVSKVLPSNSPKLKGLKADFFQENGLFKYTYGVASDYEGILKIQKQIVSKFPETIIVVFKNGKKIPLTDVVK